MADELSMREPHKRIEFQCIHRLGKLTGKAQIQFWSDFFNTLTVGSFGAGAKLKGTTTRMLFLKTFPRSCTICARLKCPNLRRQSEEA